MTSRQPTSINPGRGRGPRLSLLAPAKINLHLRVGPVRADGFHPLVTWMVTVGLFDRLALELEAEPLAAAAGVESDPRVGPPARGRAGESAVAGAAAPAARSARIVLESDLTGLPCDGTNLVARAAAAWVDAVAGRAVGGARGAEGSATGAGFGAAESDDGTEGAWGRAPCTGADGAAADGRTGGGGSAGRDDRTVGAPPTRCRVAEIRISLEKRIPVGAGLGGGSSDAARTLAGLDALAGLNQLGGPDQLWGVGPAADRLSGSAAALGSDVPFFLHGPSAACRGRGEVVRPVPAPALARRAVLVLPGTALPTAAVYRRFDELGLGRAIDVDDASEPDWAAWSQLPAEALLANLVNDLESAAFSIDPRLAALRQSVEGVLGRPVRMSGSGSSLFTLYDDEAVAARAAGEIEAAFGGGGVRGVAVEVAPNFIDDLNAPGRGR